MRIVLIGSGNTATVLGRLLVNANHTISGVYSKTVQHAQQLAVELIAQHYGSLHDITQTGELYIVAVNDDALQTIAADIKLGDKIVVHTSGSAPAAVLAACSKNYGVLYPLQSMRKEAAHQPVIPILIDGNSNEVKQLVRSVAQSVSPIVEDAGDEKRLKLHLAAVIVSNFTNHLYSLAEDFCNKEAVPFKTLVPLIQEVAARTAIYSPAGMQTGPAVRGDNNTIEKHLQLLSAYPLLQKMYGEITDSITAFYKK